MALDYLTLKLLIKDIPQLSEIPVSKIEIKELKGFTNKIYLLITEEQKFILRISRQATNKNINRENEAHNAEIAYQLKLTPEILWREKEGDLYSGMSVIAVLEDARPLIKQDFRNKEILDGIAEALVLLQSSKQSFEGCLNEKVIAQYLKKYFSLCTKSQQESLNEELNDALKLLSLIKDNGRPPVCSHIDLVAENILLENNKICLIDWEYSAMASPFWDIATICNEADFDQKESQRFLEKVIPTFSSQDVECLENYKGIVKTISRFWLIAYAESDL